MSARSIVLSLLGLVAAADAVAQDPARRDGPGPWNLDLYLQESRDGIVFEGKRPFVKSAGVPTLISDGKGHLIAAFQWFPADRPEAFDRVAISRSTDGGASWSPPGPIEVEGMPPDLRRPFDPTLVDLGGEPGYRLYFTSHAMKAPRVEERRRGGKGQKKGGGPDIETGIYSARSEDGERWRFEPGARFAVEGETVIDCAAARLGGEVHLFAPNQDEKGQAYHAVSRDGLEFRRLPDLELEMEGSWLGCALPVEGGLRFYGTGSPGQGGGWSAFSADGSAWKLDAGARRSGGADPGVARLPDGRFIMIATDAPGAGRRPAVDAGPLRAGRPAANITANDKYVYVIRGDVLYQYDAELLHLVRKVRLPPEEPPERSPAEGRRGREEER